MAPDDMLMKEIVLVYWSDIIVFYNFLSKEVKSQFSPDPAVAGLLSTSGNKHLPLVLRTLSTAFPNQKRNI